LGKPVVESVVRGSQSFGASRGFVMTTVTINDSVVN
jgi:hypothetical protein